MLSEISIRNVVLIEKLDLELKPGLTALTGETGAGKSILLDALGMATGARSDRTLVRSGEVKSVAITRFCPDKTHRIRSILKESDIEIDPVEDLVLRRSVNATGGSKAYINDTPISAKLLQRIGRQLVEVHGQHDGRGLMDVATHRGSLDSFGGHEKLLNACKNAWEELSIAIKSLEDLRARTHKADSDREFFEYAIAELDRLAPEPNEDAKLAIQRKLLQSGEAALAELGLARSALGETGDFEAALGRALAGLERVRAKLSGQEAAAVQSLNNAAKALDKALIEVEEARIAVEDAARAFDFEPGELERIEERLFALRAMARKHGVEVEELPNLRKKFANELELIDNYASEIKTAQEEANKAQKIYDKAALALSKARKTAAKELDKKVMSELPPLKMQNAKFITEISEITPGPSGRDQIRFTVSTNPGNPLGPLEKIASGGELSRFALAIKVALVGNMEENNSKVMVFDEVDQGVGGAVADAVGRRLAKLAKSGQVLVVTHSPQVAASADYQIKITKTAKGDNTLTHVQPLAANEREEEIARMLSGAKITDEARAAARKLMAAS